MKTEKLIAGAFAIILGGMAVKTFKTIIDKRNKEDEVIIEDEC